MDSERLLLLDIDQTLAGGVKAAHLKYYNKHLGLAMTDDEIDYAEHNPDWRKTFDVPQIQDYRELGEEWENVFQRTRAEIRTSPQVHLDLTALPGSPDGVRQLLKNHTFGGYYTVRPSEVEGATKEWLAKHDFPDSERVVICESPQDKLRKIVADWLVNTTHTVVLIDDSMTELIQAAEALVEEDPEIKIQLEKLVIVAFGPQKADLEGTFHLKTGLRTLKLPDWENTNLDTLQSQL